MSLKYAILILLLALTTVEQSQNKCLKPHAAYSSAVLSLYWPAHFCSRKPCIPQWQRWNGHNFGIHGYWPSYEDDDLSCLLSSYTPDPYCIYPYPYSPQIFDLSLQKDLDTYWPWLVTPRFRENEWKKHGVCYMNLIRQAYGDTYSLNQIFYGYFMQTLLKAKRHIFVSRFSFSTKEDLRQEMSIPSLDNFYVICDSEHRSSVRQVRICFTLDEPGAQSYIKCSDQYLQQMQEPCIYPIYLKQRQDIQPQPTVLLEQTSSKDEKEEDL